MKLGAFQRVILFIQMTRGMCLCCFYVYVYQTSFCHSFFQNVNCRIDFTQILELGTS